MTAKGGLPPCCSRNHPYTDANTHWRRNRHGQPYRECRKCAAELRAEHRAARRAEQSAPPSPFMLGRPPAWMDAAACLSTDPDAFFPELGRNDQARAARRICAGCPVRAECLDYALAVGEVREGIWGGLSPTERQALAAERRDAAAKIAAQARAAGRQAQAAAELAARQQARAARLEALAAAAEAGELGEYVRRAS